jgi:hypothetical protein
LIGHDKTVDVTRLCELTSLTSYGLWTDVGRPDEERNTYALTSLTLGGLRSSMEISTLLNFDHTYHHELHLQYNLT